MFAAQLKIRHTMSDKALFGGIEMHRINSILKYNFLLDISH